MKKQFFLALILCISITGCGNKQPVSETVVETEVVQNFSDILSSDAIEAEQVSNTEINTSEVEEYNPMDELDFVGLYNKSGEQEFYSYDIVESFMDSFDIYAEQEQHLLDELQQAQVQMEMTENARQRYELWDAALNNVWEILMTVLDEAERETLRAEEREWIEYKDKEVAKIGEETGGGSIQPMLEYDTAAELTKERVYELKEKLENAEGISISDETGNSTSYFSESETKYVTIDLSTVKETHTEGETVTPLNFEIISEQDNGINDVPDWYAERDLSLPMTEGNWDYFYDEVYEYQWLGNRLHIYERETGDCVYILEYPTDKWYVNGPNAYLQDGIFYGGSVMNGYAMPDTCFMFAYDLNNDKLLWRSADQTYNTMNFVVKDDIIICGYGFTAEKDYLYQLNKNTGEVIAKTELNKMPDMLIEQDGKLYVHTYSYDYVIQIN